MFKKVSDDIILALSLGLVIGLCIIIAWIDQTHRDKIWNRAEAIAKSRGCKIEEASQKHLNTFYLRCPNGVDVLTLGE